MYMVESREDQSDFVCLFLGSFKLTLLFKELHNMLPWMLGYEMLSTWTVQTPENTADGTLPARNHSCRKPCCCRGTRPSTYCLAWIQQPRRLILPPNNTERGAATAWLNTLLYTEEAYFPVALNALRMIYDHKGKESVTV